MNVLVMYASKHGAAKQYAEWIADTLDADCRDCREVTPDLLSGYDSVIFGGGLYAGMLRGKKILLRNADLLKHKNLVLFTVGLTPADSRERTETLQKAFPDTLWCSLRHFPLRGRMELERLGRLERMLINMVGKAQKSATEKGTSQQADGADMLSGDVDYMDRETLRPLIDYVRKQESK